MNPLSATLFNMSGWNIRFRINYSFWLPEKDVAQLKYAICKLVKQIAQSIFFSVFVVAGSNSLRDLFCWKCRFYLHGIVGGFSRDRYNAFHYSMYKVWRNLYFCRTLHRGAFCQFPLQWIYYYGSNKSNGKETGKMHLCALTKTVCSSDVMHYQIM